MRRSAARVVAGFAGALAVAAFGLPSTASAVTQTFNFTGGAQTFTVPPGVTQITVEALGAQGGASQSGAAAGGLGGRAIATIAVTPGEALEINVGGQGGMGNPAPGGFNGGGAGGPDALAGGGGGGGGGASDVRQGGTGFAARVVIAGGGGGGGRAGCTGGSGGGTAGAGGSPCAQQEGGGGSQTAGGIGSPGGTNPGTAGAAGAGGAGGAASGGGHGGGGGGGGLFGGGGGAGGGAMIGGGGGGGSGRTPDGTGMTNGVRTGDGQVTLTYTVTPTLTTNASGEVVTGGQVTDTATLAGGASPTGQITFRLYGPDDADCSGTPVFTDTQTASGNGAYGSASFTPTAAGTYRWIASYSGDADNAAVAGTCNDPNESVKVVGPELRTSLVAGLVKGTVLIREPGSGGIRKRGPSGFSELTGTELIPVGSSVDTTDGRVGITSATKHGGTQRTEFYDGQFKVDQSGNGQVTAKLQDANFGSCNNRSKTTRASKKLARLWGNGKGRARSKGRRGSGTVRGTIWLTEERCSGTFFKVRKGKLRVRDFERKKNITLRRGDKYLAERR